MSTPCAASTRVTAISPTSTNRNPAQGSYHLLDLINEIVNVSLALEEFEAANSRHLTDAAVKHLGVMSESLKRIAEKSRTGFW